MEVRVNIPRVTMSDAVDGMRRPFLDAFGRTVVGRRLASAAWAAFHSALTHGSGLHVAASHARVAAEERNDRTALVARWSAARIRATVQVASRTAADAG